MDKSHDDENFTRKIVKIWSKTCVFCCEKYPIPTVILILFFLLYLFFPLVFTFLIYSSPFVGFSLLVHRIFLGVNRQKAKHVEEDRRRKYAKSRRSFKSNHRIRRKSLNKSGDCIDTDVEDDDDIFLKSLSDLLTDKKPKDIREVSFESIVGRGECSSSNGNVNCNKGVSEDDKKPQDHKVVRWMEDDQKNAMDLGLSEAERNKRLQGLMQRRRSRKNLGFEEGGSTENNNNVQVSTVKTTKINPFLEDNSSSKKSPGSAPSTLLTTSNPFDLPYDPHEEKLDLSGDNFREEFTVGQPKDPVFCRHESFSLGAFAHSAIASDDHELSCCKDLSHKQKSDIGLETSTLGTGGDNKHIQNDSPISDDSIDSNHPKEEGASSGRADGVIHEEDGTDIEPQEVDSFDERKADINFFYGSHKKVYHAASHSIVSDMQVELSDEETVPTLDDRDIEKERERLLNSLNSQKDTETNKNSKLLNSDAIQSNHIHEPHGSSQSSVAQAALDGLTEVSVGQASVSSSSLKYVLQREYSADPSDSVQQNSDSGEHPFHDRDIDNLQDQNVHRL